MADRYASYAELLRDHAEGRDFRVHVRHADSPYAIVAPHGGRIERGTLQIADAIAGVEHTFYAFEGIRPRANRVLHITSNRFDEPRALAAVARARTVVSVHGAFGDAEVVWAGGLDLALRAHLLARLCAAGFAADDDPSPTRQGRGPTNICNRGRSGRGVQFELPAGLRRRLYERLPAGGWRPAPLFEVFVATLRAALADA